MEILVKTSSEGMPNEVKTKIIWFLLGVLVGGGGVYLYVSYALAHLFR